MKTELDKMIDDIQEQADAKGLEQYGPKAFERWRLGLFAGRLKECSCSGRVTGSCGDTMEIFLLIRDGRVAEAGYEALGCAASQVSGSACCELAMGRNLEEASSITPGMILELLGGLPEEESHCANVASKALEAAIHDFMTRGGG